MRKKMRQGPGSDSVGRIGTSADTKPSISTLAPPNKRRIADQLA